MGGATISSDKKSKTMSVRKGEFNAQAFLDSTGVARRVRAFKRTELIYSQGDAASSVMYL
jgi:hypothetical protein